MIVSLNVLNNQRKLLLIASTIVVAFCSIAYELILSQFLTIFYGGTVVRYSITIGLFLFSLGIGSYLYKFVKNQEKVFYLVEIILSVFAPISLFVIVMLNSLNFFNFINLSIIILISHLPIIIIGILSGLEIPLLSYLSSKEKNETETAQSFAEVLGFDYLGSLFGAVIFSLVLYPFFGIIFALLFISSLNALVALLFALKYYRKGIYLAIVILLFFLIALFNYSSINDKITSIYAKANIENKYSSIGIEIENVSILNTLTTPYQEVVFYSMDYKNSFVDDDICMNLDSHIQLCESWLRSYHQGLVQFPMSFFDNEKNLSILVLGGGDWITFDELIKYDSISLIDHVDIDKSFFEYAKNDSFLKRFHNDSFKDKRITTYDEDAYYFLKKSNKTYDLIILDLPGAEHDKLLPLFSQEFFVQLENSLNKGGIVASWGYRKEVQEEHIEILFETFRQSGFNWYLDYRSYITTNEDVTLKMEQYYIFSKNKKTFSDFNNTQYLKEYRDYYLQQKWRKIEKNEIKVNSLLKPNYNIIIS